MAKHHLWNLVVAVVLVVTLAAPRATPLRSLQLAPQTWSNTGNLAVARDQHTATLLPNGKVLIATVLQNLLIGRHRHRRTNVLQELIFSRGTRAAKIEAREKVEQVIDFLDLQHHRDTMVAGLPYGVRKVVELARALATQPRLLLLDEPSSGLNVEETEDMAFWIDDICHELGITVLMVEHDMTLVSRVSDRVVALNQGQVLAVGTPRVVQSHAGVVEAYLGTADDATSLRRSAA